MSPLFSLFPSAFSPLLCCRRSLRVAGAALAAWAWLAGAPAQARPDPQELAARHAPQQWQAARKYPSVRVFTVGDGPARVYVFMPDSPQAKSLPLVLFHHGWMGMNPRNFGGLIDLMVRRGAVVFYPVYQDGEDTPPQAVSELAAQANAQALRDVQQHFPGLVDSTKTLYWGFSMGAGISLNLALEPQRHGLPAPRALLLVAPGDAPHVATGERAASILPRVERLPRNLPTLIVTGAADTAIGVPTARALAARLCHLPPSRRNLLLFPSDTDGESRITAGHGSPGAPDSRYDFPDARATVGPLIAGREDFEASTSLNLLDFYGYWRVTMRLLDHVDGGRFPAELFSRTDPENRFLGLWPSGRPYAQAQIEDHCRKKPRR